MDPPIGFLTPSQSSSNDTTPPHQTPSTNIHHLSMSTTKPTSSTTVTKPLIKADPTAVIHDKVTITGIHPITISARAIIHPFAKVDSTHGPIEIGEGALVWEKAVVGVASSSHGGDQVERDAESESAEAVGTVVGAFASVGPHSTVHASARMANYSTLEAGAVVEAGATVGDFAKIGSCCVIAARATVKPYTTVFMLGEKQMERVNEAVKGDVEGVRAAFVRNREKEVALLKRVVKGGAKWTT